MRAEAPSRTAAYMALFRAIESSRPPADRLFDDPLASAFLDRRLGLAATVARVPVVGRLVPSYIDRRWPGPRPSGVIRTRVIDDLVRDALAAGCGQLVLLGAGYDTRAYRIPEAAEVDTFEVDHPSTQTAKRAALEREIGTTPPRVHFVPVDFERDSLGEAIAAAGFRDGAQTCVVWEGVFSYLTDEAIDETLGWVVGACAPRSRLVLTYVDQAALLGRDSGPEWIAAVNQAGEPFITGLDPSASESYFADRGLRLLEDQSTKDHARRLAPDEVETIPDLYRVALLEVAPTRA
jgi:methyltransferase (TIGR00027 family)